MRALPSLFGLLVLTACGGAGGEDAQSVGEDLSGNASAIDIGFNGGPDQFAAFPLFFQKDVQAGPRLCHTYLAWDVANEAPAMGTANSPEGKRAWFEYWLHEAAGQCDEALVTFKALSPSAPPSGGPSGQFAKAFEAFLAQPWAQETGFTGSFAFTPWNEPNNPGGAGSGLGKVLPPDLAAQYYLAAEHACRVKSCKVAAGDLASNGDWWNDFEWNCGDDNVASSQLCKVDSSENPGHAPASYLDRYKNYIANHATEYGLPRGFRPGYFAFHGWHDINEYLDTGNHCASYGDCATRRLLTSLGGSWGGVRIWDTEAGVDQDAAPISNTEQACGSAFLLRDGAELAHHPPLLHALARRHGRARRRGDSTARPRGSRAAQDDVRRRLPMKRAAMWPLLTATVVAGCGGAGDENLGQSAEDLGTRSYQNPVIRMYDRPAGVATDLPAGAPHEATEGCPDPQGLKTRGGDYFIYCTSYTWRRERLNGFPVFKSESRTLAGPWQPVGSIIADRGNSRRAWPAWVKDANGARDGDFWGPDVHELPNGKFVASYSAPCGAHRCVGIAWADGPDGPWTHPAEPLVTPSNNTNENPGGDSYDPSLLVTASGNYYYWVVPGRGVYGIQVDYGSEGRLRFHPGAKIFQIADRAKGQRGEGPYVVEHDGGFYEFYSTGSLLDGYYVGVRRGESPDAPFTEEGPVVVHPGGRFVASGGNSLIQNATGGLDFLVYHAIVVPPGGGCPRIDPEFGGEIRETSDNPHCRVQGERQAMIDAIEWRVGAGAHAWPVLANGTGAPSEGNVRLP